MALETLAQVVAIDTAAVQRHRNTIVECVKDADVSIRKRALDLVYALVNENNIKTLTNELLEYLEVCDEEFKPDLTAKVCMLVQRFSPDKRWYIDSLGQVLVQAGAYVKEEVVRALIVTVSNAPDLQGYAVRLLYRALINMVEDGDEALRLAALWCLGRRSSTCTQHVIVKLFLIVVYHGGQCRRQPQWLVCLTHRLGHRGVWGAAAGWKSAAHTAWGGASDCIGSRGGGVDGGSAAAKRRWPSDQGVCTHRADQDVVAHAQPG